MGTRASHPSLTHLTIEAWVKRSEELDWCTRGKLNRGGGGGLILNISQMGNKSASQEVDWLAISGSTFIQIVSAVGVSQRAASQPGLLS